MAPGGIFLIRDYGRGDMAEKRFTKNCGKKKISENFFVRKDGTRAYYSTIGNQFIISFFLFPTFPFFFVLNVIYDHRRIRPAFSKIRDYRE